MAKIGRPSKMTSFVTEEICERLSRGEPLARICDDPKMPSYSTVRKWESEDAEFSALSARAKRDGTHYLADESLTIADEQLPEDPEVARVDVAHRKLKIDTRMRLIGKWNAAEYGDKQAVELTGKDGKAIEIEQRVKEDADAVSSAVLGLAERARASGVAGQP